jgi:hypothetical protein
VQLSPKSPLLNETEYNFDKLSIFEYAKPMTTKPISKSDLIKAARTQRSTLYEWMIENHDDFSDVISKTVRPNWSALAKTFSDSGYKDGDGKPPTGEVCRQSWWRVRKALAARQKTSDRSSQTPQPAPADHDPVQSNRGILSLIKLK